MKIFLIGIVLSFLVAFFSYRLKFLTFSGSIATFILAVLIFGLGFIKWTVPILAFYIPSSLLTKLSAKNKKNFLSISNKNNSRNYVQVLSNGGFPVIFMLINFFIHSEIWFVIYIVYLATMSSDTWATEIGTMKVRKTYNILTLTKCEQGISGGISIVGLLASFVGAIMVVLSAIQWLTSLDLLILLVCVGFLGSLFDSLIGASIQAKFECIVCGKISENKVHCNTNAKLIQGVKFINNDFVNVASGLFSVFTVSIIYLLVY